PGQLEFSLLFGESAQIPDNGHLPWLRLRRERPRCRRRAEQRDELASPHSITSSARASRVGGGDRSSALVVFRLMISSNLIGCSTGRSAGFAPLKILSTHVAARRNKSRKSTP